MAVTINADNGAVSGSAGLKTTPDSTGVLALQTNGTTAVTISTSQITTLSSTVISVSSSSEALRVTQTGAGNALLVEDSANPDSTPFVVDASGNVGIGTLLPDATLTVNTIASFGDGAAATPSIAHKGDLNTGIYFSAADTVDIATAGAQVAQLDSTGNLKFNSGYGSVATAYGCRAWVNFDGTAAGTFAGGASTVTRISGSTTATVTTTTAHGLITGNTVYALTGVVAGSYVITKISDTSFSFTTVATTALSAVSITFAVSSIRASGNVSSVADVAAGQYAINFATAMPDANYVLAGTTTQGAAGMVIGTASSSAGSAPTLKTTTTVRVDANSTSGALNDVFDAYIVVFR